MNDGASVGLEQALEQVATALAAMGSGDPGPYAALWAEDADDR